MSVNFYFDICSLIVVITLICSICIKKLVSRSSYFFVQLLVLCLCACLSRIIWQVLFKVAEPTPFNRGLTYFIIYLHYGFALLIMPAAAHYILATAGLSPVLRKSKTALVMMPLGILIPVVSLVYNFFTDKLFFVTGGFQYFEYTTIGFYYLGQVLILVFTLICLFYFRKSISKTRIIFGIILIAMNIGCTFFQIYFPDFRIGLFVITMSCYLILILSQRPEFVLNPKVHTCTEFAFFEKLKVCFSLKSESKILLFKIVNHKDISLYTGAEKYLEFLGFISSKVSQNIEAFRSRTELYFLSDSIFALTCESARGESILKDIGDYIILNFGRGQKVRFENFDIFPTIASCIVSVPQDIDNIEYFRYFSRGFDRVIEQPDSVVQIGTVSKTKNFKIRNEIETILAGAFENNHFEVFFQPIWGVKEKRFVSAEALVRLNDPVYGYISPSVFISVAESSGVIHKIGDLVFEKVCQFIALPEFTELGLSHIEVNLTAGQCVETNLTDKVSSAMKANDVTPDQIRFEITESTADFNPVISEQNIKALHDMGICFSLDDYGTGYSNIKKVTSLPFDVVKLDKSFVDEMENPVMWTIIQDTIHMLKKLNKKVLVEGIEDKKTAEIFQNLVFDGESGCDYIQGYYYSKPLPQNEFVEFIRNNK